MIHTGAQETIPKSRIKRENTLGSEPQVLVFCCEYCARSAAVLAGVRRMQYSPGVRIIPVPCTGKIEMEHILEAFDKGVDGVLVVGCLEGGCHHVDGNLRAGKRVERIRELLDEIGLAGERLRMVCLADSMARDFVRNIEDITQVVRRLGANPLRELVREESAGTL